VVVRASKSGRYYAIKVYSDYYLEQKGHLECSAADIYSREREILNSIQHPQVPGYVDSFCDGNRYYLVQEYVQGNTLTALIEQGYRFDENLVKVLLADLLGIIDFLHTANDKRQAIIHRDLRLSNLMLAEGGLLLIDFGLAYRMKNNTDAALLTKWRSMKASRGISPSYEKMRQDLSLKSDLFGAGVVAVDLFSNSVVVNQSLKWEAQIPVSQPFKSFIRSLLGVEGNFASCKEAIKQLSLLSRSEGSNNGLRDSKA